MIVLAESHMSLHTWPEKKYVTLDVYVCSYTQDNREKAKNLFKALEDLFQPTNKNYKEISETIGISEVNARVKMNRVKKKLKKQLNP